jgi:nicotinamide phosphoribosyltransferase
VIRPDSGDPVKIICGDASEPNGSPAHKGAIECLWEVFGGTVTERGYKMLDPHIGLIYGDSITPDRAWKIMEGLKQKGFASGNVVFGVGSYTYQYVTRDTYGFAVKSTYGEINGNPCDIFKDPVTDSGIKKSARGRLKVLRLNGNLTLLDGQYGLEGGELVPVFRDGKLLVEQTLAEIRARVAA